MIASVALFFKVLLPNKRGNKDSINFGVEASDGVVKRISSVDVVSNLQVVVFDHLSNNRPTEEVGREDDRWLTVVVPRDKARTNLLTPGKGSDNMIKETVIGKTVGDEF